MADENYTRITLRIPKDLLQQVNRSARDTSKSQNAEIVGRLQGSFDFMAVLPPAIRDAVAEVVEAKNCTPEAALADLVLAGQSNGGQVLNIRIAPGMTLKEIRDAPAWMSEVVPNATSVVVERE